MYQSGAQNYPGSKLFTCREKKISYENLFRLVYEQTGMTAFYNDEQLDSHEEVSVDFRNEPLDNALALLLRKRGMAWCYRKDVFVIAYKRPGDIDLGVLPGEEQRIIAGRVVNEKQAPLEAVTIVTGDTLNGTNTGKDGRFFLRDVKPGTGLIIRRMGYKPIFLSSFPDTVYIQMVPVVAPLKGVNVPATALRPPTGAVGSVNNKEIEESSANNVLGALQGRIPGLYINQITGLPGGGYRIRLRGKNSIESISDPLILVDGIPFPAVSFNENYANTIGQAQSPTGTNVNPSPLNLLNVKDIASVQILKDADATAIYGAQGANGVIVITSKAPGEEKGLTANVYSGFGQAVKLVRYMDTKQYISMRKEGIRNDDGNRPLNTTTDYDIAGVADWDTTSYTDWQKKMIGGTSNILEGNIEYQGGGGQASYRFSGLYRQESTVYPADQFRYKKGGAMAQARFHSRDERIKINFLANYIADKNLLPVVDLTFYSSLPPTTPESHTGEKVNFWTGDFINPYASILRTSKTTSWNLRSDLNGRYEATKDLTFKINIGSSLVNVKEIQANPAASYDPSVGGFNDSYFFDNRYRNFISDLQAVWIKTIGKERVSLLVGSRFQYEDQLRKNYYGFMFPDDHSLEDTAKAGDVMWLDSINTNYHYHSLYSRIELKHQDKYVLTFNVNRDRSERVAFRHRFGYFLSSGAAWIFSSEPFFKKISWLSYGKLRASYGTTGNDQYVRNLKRNTFLPDSVLSLHGIQAANVISPSHDWEKIRRAEIAIDLRVIDNRFSGTLCYYTNKSRNQLLTGAFPVANNSDILYVPVNFPAIVTNKGFEMDLEATLIQHRNITWNASLNVSFPRNKLVAFPDLNQTKYQVFYTEGMALDLIKGYQLKGVDRNSGIYRFTDVGRPGLYLEDRFGQELGPFFYGGLYNNVRFKNFEISCLIRFARQNNYNYLFASPYIPGGVGNQPVAIQDRWQAPGDEANVQRYSTSLNTRAGRAFLDARESDQQITDASYLRLQSLIFSYHLSTHMLKRFKINSCRFYVQGLNLFTISKYAGRDPEIISSSDTYPSLRVITAGIQINLF